MNIYELEKLATSGPVHTDDGYMTSDSGIMVAQAGPDANGFDLSLLTHCRNNFMLALEGLKRVAAYGNGGKSLNPYELRGYLNQLIAELEEVK